LLLFQLYRLEFSLVPFAAIERKKIRQNERVLVLP